MRIAIVKSHLYRDLYTMPGCGDQIVFSSAMRSGPASFIFDFSSDFYIVDCDSYGVNNEILFQKIPIFFGGSFERFQAASLKELVISGELKSIRDFAVSASSIDFSKYDIVICLDACIDLSIINDFPNALWCYYVSEPPCPEYKLSRLRPYPGYDVFLNQRFRTDADYFLDPNLTHEIDFPYIFLSRKSFPSKFSCDLNSKNGLFVEKDSRSLLSSDEFNLLDTRFGCSTVSGDIKSLLTAIGRSKYFIRIGSRAVWGNALIEAYAADSLIISSTRGFRNRIFSFPANSIGGVDFDENQFSSLLTILENFESNQNLYMACLENQRVVGDELLYNRPISKLLFKALEKKRK